MRFDTPPGADNIRHRVSHARARLSIPEVAGLQRPRLLNQLDALLQVRLGMVIAPAGFGKTTLMAQWARRVPIDVAWYRADPADSTATAVVQQLGAALATISPVHPATPDLDTLVLAIERHESPVVLVIDDLHTIAHTHVEHLLQKLLLLGPPHLHFLIGSRRAPTFNMARMELPTLQLGEEDLRLRQDETAQLFRDHYRMALTGREVSQLAHHTEGWPAAVHLFQRSVTGKPSAQRRRAIRGLDGRVRYARDYLSSQILGSMPDELQDFLRRTSVLETLTASRCDALLDGTNSQRRLLDLERRPSLLHSHDGGETFALHQVLRRHLETDLLDEFGRTRARSWYRRTGEILETEEVYAAAARAFAQAGDWPMVRRLLDEYGAAIVLDRTSSWLDLMPQDLVDDQPWLLIAHAQRALDEGRLKEAKQLTDRATLMSTGLPDPTEVATRIATCVDAWRGTRPPADGDGWTILLREVTRTPPLTVAGSGSHRTGPQVRLLRALALIVGGDFVGGKRAVAAAVEELDDDLHARFAARLAAAALSDDHGAAADAVADDAERTSLTWFARVARGLAGAQRLRVETIGSADDRLATDLMESENRDDGWGAALLAGARCVALLRAGKPDVQALEDLVSRLHELDAPSLEAWGRAGLALATAATQLPDAVREAEAAEALARTAGVPGALAIAYGALAHGRPKHRVELLELAESTAEATGLTCLPWRWLEPPPEPVPLPTQMVVVSREPAPMTVHCFGRFELRVRGERPDLNRVRPRAREVLRLLALEAGRPVHRELLIDALWRDLDPAAGTHNLQVCVSSLRTVLEPGVPRGASRLLVRDGDRYQLTLPPGSFSDLPAFDQAILRAERARSGGDITGAIAAINVAMELYTGEVLPEDGPAEWVIGVRERYRVRVAEAAASLAELHLARHDPGAAATAAMRSIDADPCRDASWRLLLTAYTAAGDLAAAEQARRSYADVLSSLGVVSDSAAAVLPRPRRHTD